MMQLQFLNAHINAARRKVQKKYNPGDDDFHMRTLKAAIINEDDYFANIVHDDIDGIIRDIKNAHRGDRTSAPETNLAETFQQNLEKAQEVKGPWHKRAAMLFYNALGINDSKLTIEESSGMEKALQKSEVIKSTVSQRGKSYSQRT